MSVAIRVSRSPGERRVALLRGGVMMGFRVERPARPDGVGDVWRGRVQAVVPALSGAFVALGDGPAGFLPDSECEGRRPPPEGAAVTVRVTRAAQGGKGPRLSARVAQGGSGPPALLERGPDQARRWRDSFPDAPLLADDAAEALRLGGRYDPAAFAPLEDEAAALAEPVAALPGGGRLVVSPLPALTALDVDGGGQDPREANRLALPEIARQVALRDLAGPVVLDLAGLPAKARAAFDAPLRAAFAGDGLVRPLGFGPLGLWEFTRARIHPPLHEVLADRALARGLALLRRAAREAAAAPHRRLALVAPAAVLAAIHTLPGALEEVGAPLALREGAEEEIQHG